MAATDPEIVPIADAIRARQRFVISSHSRPDGDSLGSQLAMAFALQALGKDVTVVNFDAAAPPFMVFPGVPGVTIAPGANSIVGRSLVVHRDPDDYLTQPSGISGPRLACGAITAQ